MDEASASTCPHSDFVSFFSSLGKIIKRQIKTSVFSTEHVPFPLVRQGLQCCHDIPDVNDEIMGLEITSIIIAIKNREQMKTDSRRASISATAMSTTRFRNRTTRLFAKPLIRNL